MDKHPIDRLFRDKLDSHEWAFNESAWDDALTLLRSQKRKKRRLLVFWWTMGSLALLIISGLAWTFFRQSSQDHKAIEIVANQDLPFEEKLTTETSASPMTPADMVDNSAKGLKPKDNVNKELMTSVPQLNENHITLHNPKANGALEKPRISKDFNFNVSDNQISQHGRDQSNDLPLDLMTPVHPVPLIGTLVDQVKWNYDLAAPIASVVPVVKDRMLPVHRTAGGLISGLTLTFLTDVNPGLLSSDQEFQDHSLRIGFQQAFSPFFAVEIRGGSRVFIGDLPVHAQTAQVKYAIGSETTTYQLEADKLFMVGAGLALHTGYRKHRLSAALDVDRLIAARGILRQQLFIQERRLQDRTAKPVTVSEQRTWVDTEGITPWNYSTELSYRYAINPKFEIGFAWIHRYQELVINDEYFSDRLSVTVKKIF